MIYILHIQNMMRKDGKKQGSNEITGLMEHLNEYGTAHPTI